MSTMNSEVCDALIDACGDEIKACEAAKSVVRYDNGVAEIEASRPLVKWVVSFTLAFVPAFTCQVFQ